MLLVSMSYASLVAGEEQLSTLVFARAVGGAAVWLRHWAGPRSCISAVARDARNAIRAIRPAVDAAGVAAIWALLGFRA